MNMDGQRKQRLEQRGKKRVSSNSTNNATTADAGPPKRQNTKQTLQYHLVLNDGTVTFDEKMAQLSSILTSTEPGEVPCAQFSVSTAKSLQQVIHHQTSGNLLPTEFALTLQFADFLCIDTVCKTMLGELEVPNAQDPLARLRSSYALLPSLCTMLQRWLEIDSTSHQEIQELINKLVSNNSLATIASCLTYGELDLCDGQHFGDESQRGFTNLRIKEQDDDDDNDDDDDEDHDEDQDDDDNEKIHPVSWGHLSLSSLAACERARRLTLIANHVAHTKELRTHLPKDNSSEEGQALDLEFTTAMFAGNHQTAVLQSLQMTNFVLNKRVLDLSMWRAVKEGRVDVAEQLFGLGATPTLMLLPNDYDSDYSSGGNSYSYNNHHDGDYADVMISDQTKSTFDGYQIKQNIPLGAGDLDHLIGSSMTQFKSTLMLATYNNDIPMMNWLLSHGCDVNVCQPSFVLNCDEPEHFGGMSALSMVGSDAAMKTLLSHGANPNMGYIAFGSTYSDDLPNISVLLHLVSDDTFGKTCFREVNWNVPYDSPLRLSLARLLVKSGADVNESTIDSIDQEGEGELLTYWPNVVIACAREAQKASSTGNSPHSSSSASPMQWCEQLLARHGADANWPCNSECCSPQFCYAANPGRVHGSTVLLMAVVRNHIPLVKLLLHYGANPNQYEIPHFGEDEDSGKRNIKSLERCFDFAGDIFDKYKYQSPLSAAKNQNNINMVQLLESHGANTPLEVDLEGYKLMYPCPYKGQTWDEVLFFGNDQEEEGKLYEIWCSNNKNTVW